MSYCVNCGVELDDSAKRCALCSTEVINPNKKQSEQQPEAPFSAQVHVPEGAKKRFIASLITVIMLIPNVVCLACNIMFSDTVFWSLYVIATSVLVWLVFVLPLFVKRKKTYLMWSADTLGTAFYSYFLFLMGGGDVGIYTKVVLPIIMIISALVLIYLLWSKDKNRNALLKAAHVFLDLSLISLASGLLLGEVAGITYALGVGIICFVSGVITAVFFAYCYGSKSMRSYLEKKFFVN